MTQQKNLNALDLEKVSSRRSRKDEEGRDFQCGCGKRYLSYPALYTHIKTKHNGQQPEGTQKMSTTMIPKKIKGKSQQQLKGLVHHLQKDDIKLLSELEEHMLGSVPLHYRFRKDHISKEIYQNYLILIKNPDMTFQKTSNLDLLLALYLFNIGEYINEKLYDHYILFSKILRNCFVEHGQEVFQTCFSKADSSTFLTTFTNGQVQYLPIICDFFLRYYIPHLQNTKESKDINLSLMELILSDFCTWLFRKKLTPIRISLKKEYRLQTKPVPLMRHRSHNHKNQNKDKEVSVSDSKKDNSYHSSDEVSEEMEEEENQSNEEIQEEQKEDSKKGDQENNGQIQGKKVEDKGEKGQQEVNRKSSNHKINVEQKKEPEPQNKVSQVLLEEKKEPEPESKVCQSPLKHQNVPRQFHPIQTIPQPSQLLPQNQVPQSQPPVANPQQNK